MEQVTEQTAEFGDWLLLSRLDKKYSLCRCKCGTERRVVTRDLRNGKSRGCGCTRMPKFRAAQKAVATTHGKSHTAREYTIWIDMRRRCHQPQRPDYHRYGGRGIVVCERWRNDFAAFYADMGQRPDGCSLERRDNDGPYSPENCFWASKKVQDNNKRTSVRYAIFGEKLTLPEAAERYGICAATLRSRIELYGWAPVRAVTVPVDTRRRTRRAA